MAVRLPAPAPTRPFASGISQLAICSIRAPIIKALSMPCCLPGTIRAWSAPATTDRFASGNSNGHDLLLQNEGRQARYRKERYPTLEDMIPDHSDDGASGF